MQLWMPKQIHNVRCYSTMKINFLLEEGLPYIANSSLFQIFEGTLIYDFISLHLKALSLLWQILQILSNLGNCVELDWDKFYIRWRSSSSSSQACTKLFYDKNSRYYKFKKRFFSTCIIPKHSKRPTHKTERGTAKRLHETTF